MTRRLQIAGEPMRKPRIYVQSALDGDQLAPRAIERAVLLAAGIRDEGPHTVASETDTLARQELVALVVALAAMVPADVDPVRALRWIETPAAEWPADLLAAEARRHDDGARDGTAVLAVMESDRRLAAMDDRAHLHRPAADVEGRAS